MPTFTSEDLELLRQGARGRAEAIARRMREIDEHRRALWQRMDLRREQGAALAPADGGVITAAVYPPAAPPTPTLPEHGANPAPGQSRALAEPGSQPSARGAETMALAG
jgi:hypothetical protein